MNQKQNPCPFCGKKLAYEIVGSSFFVDCLSLTCQAHYPMKVKSRNDWWIHKKLSNVAQKTHSMKFSKQWYDRTFNALKQDFEIMKTIAEEANAYTTDVYGNTFFEDVTHEFEERKYNGN